MESKYYISTFSQHRHVAYPIKGMTNATTFSVHTYNLDPWVGVKGQDIVFVLKVDMLHIQLKEMELRAPCKHIFCHYTHPRPLGGVKTFFTESSQAAYQIKREMEHRAQCKHILCPYTHPQSSDGVIMSKHFFLKVVMLHIKLKGMEHIVMKYLKSSVVLHLIELYI